MCSCGGDTASDEIAASATVAALRIPSLLDRHQAMPTRQAIVCALYLASFATAAHAQIQPDQGAVADAWLRDALEREADLDSFGRYAAAPSAVLLGAAMLIIPPFADQTRSAQVAEMLGGGMMLTAAIGTWAQSDAYAARRWFAAWWSLGFVGLSTGLLLSCGSHDAVCGDQVFANKLGLSIAIGSTAIFLANFVLALLSAPPSAAALELQVRDLPDAQRHTRVHEFLERRERARRIGNYVSFPLGLAYGISQLAFAHEATTSGARVAAFGLGGLVLGLTLGLGLYELLRETDVERLQAGELP